MVETKLWVPTKESLIQLAPASAKYYDDLIAGLKFHKIGDKREICGLLGQICHESKAFSDVEEDLSYSAQGLANTWPTRYAVVKGRDSAGKNIYAKHNVGGRMLNVPNQKALQLERKPQALANDTYANRMGNGGPETGDGWKHRGMGLKQVTGKENQTKYSKWKYGDLRVANNPEAFLLLPPDAVGSALWYWVTANCGEAARRGDWETVTKRINGGLIGYDDGEREIDRPDDRLDWTQRAETVVKFI